MAGHEILSILILLGISYGDEITTMNTTNSSNNYNS